MKLPNGNANIFRGHAFAQNQLLNRSLNTKVWDYTPPPKRHKTSGKVWSQGSCRLKSSKVPL